MGRAKAAVLPVPVWAQPSRSLLSKMAGIDCCCMGVGVLYPSFFSAFKMGSDSPNCSNVNFC